jgi:hypothetical protein
VAENLEVVSASTVTELSGPLESNSLQQYWDQRIEGNHVVNAVILTMNVRLRQQKGLLFIF